MKAFNRPLYLCSECKSITYSVEDLLFVQENSKKGFCSEACIEDFYRPLIQYFTELEAELRKKYKLEEEKIPFIKEDGLLVEDILQNPSAIWKFENELNESLSTYVKYYGECIALLICSEYDNQASFIFFKTVTKSNAFLLEFKPVEIKRSHQDDDISEDDFQFLELLENKKSKVLADILSKRKDSDISFEDFSKYEFCFQDCLDNPDEVFEGKDKEGDVFFNYIKSFVHANENFFYIISCLKRVDSETTDELTVFPVLAFPTNDLDLYAEFRLAKKISSSLKN